MTGAGSAANGRFCCVAVLAVGLAIGAGSQAQAAHYYYYSNYGEPDFYRPTPRPSPRQHRERHGHSQNKGKPERESAKPQGPLIIAISINQQRLKIYDANGVFAESPVSTGMRGHSTPMGVFSVIQKHKFHRSNIYSNAPMPYMQRITWSGVAMHAGVLPGYPASHGCIRMPTAFAMKMWNWTRMGARVVITPGELAPATFAHALLPTQKVAPQPVAAAEPDADKALGAKAAFDAMITKSESTNSESARTRIAGSTAANVGADLALRTSFGHDDGVKTVTSGTTLREQTHTADASGDKPARRVTMSDASAGSSEPQHADGAAKSDIKSESQSARAMSNPGDVRNEVKSAAKADDATAAKTAAAAALAERIAKSEASKSEAIKSQDTTNASSKTSPKPDDRSIDAATEPKTETGIEAKTEAVKVDPAKAAGDATMDKDQARPTDIARETAKESNRPAAVKTTPSRRAGQIAIFISRKDSKLYARQNFAPLFEVPVTIAPSDRPLGTHVFTADVDRSDANLLHWSVVSLPASTRNTKRADEEHNGRRRKAGAAVEAKPLPVPDTPAEALDRIGIPADAMTRVSDALTSGGSIIVSDQGINQGETGEGTDFIVSLR